MTQEERELLLKDLCARLPYGIKVHYQEEICSIDCVCPDGKILLIDKYGTQLPNIGNNLFEDINNIKPYLHPMSSMTEEEKEDYFNVCDEDIETLSKAMDAPDIIISDRGRTQGYIACKELEWLYKHHFDFIRKVGGEYKTLVDLGLALEAPKEIYNN